MSKKNSSMTAIGIILLAVIIGCSSTTNPTIDDGDEESDAELALDQTYDNTLSGVRLILTYDANSNIFNGTIENTTDEPLKNVRVEVNLSNGIELTPTKSTDLAPREKVLIKLTGTSTDFDGWTAHLEVDSTEDTNDEEEEQEGEDTQN